MTHRDGRQGYQHSRCGSSTSRGACLGNPGGKFFHCIQVGGQSESTVLLLYGKHFRSEEPGLGKGRGVSMFCCYLSQCVNVLLLLESLYLICPPYVGRHSGGELFS